MHRQRGEIVSVVIHVMAAAGLCGSAMAAPVVRDDAIAVLQEEQHLRVPVIRRKRPAVAEHDGLTFAPVLVEDFYAVSRGDRAHDASSLAPVKPLRCRNCLAGGESAD